MSARALGIPCCLQWKVKTHVTATCDWRAGIVTVVRRQTADNNHRIGWGTGLRWCTSVTCRRLRGDATYAIRWAGTAAQYTYTAAAEQRSQRQQRHTPSWRHHASMVWNCTIVWLVLLGTAKRRCVDVVAAFNSFTISEHRQITPWIYMTMY